MKLNIIIPLSILIISSAGCKKSENNPVIAGVVESEDWEFIMNGDTSNHGHTTLQKRSDGSMTSSAVWYFQNGNYVVTCPFEGGTVAVADTDISISASGKATNPDPIIPSGYGTSPFTINVAGIAHNGISYGNWTITFSQIGWPPPVSGTYTAIKSGGSGITN